MYKGPRLVKWIENVFLYMDIAAFITQDSGGGLMAQPKLAEIGTYTALAGMAISCVNFVTFVGVILYLHVNIRRESVHVYNRGIQRLLWSYMSTSSALPSDQSIALLSSVSDLPKPPLISPVFHDGNNGVYYVTAGDILG